jgi:YfiH family protein
MNNLPMKNQVRHPSIISVPYFERIARLRHGFGNRDWQAGDFKRSGDWKRFHPVFLKQVHSDIVHFIEKRPRPSLRGDALVTRVPGFLLVIKTADCLPVLLVEEKTRVVAAVHCGWKGTRLKVLEKAVREMSGRYGVDARSLLAAFGPCIGGGCYEVGEDVRALYAEGGFPDSMFAQVPGHPEKYLFDLRTAARLQLMGLGMKAENIFSIDICTHCDPAYPSFRRDKDTCGRMLGFIGLTPP